MYFIEISGQPAVISNNPPTDEIACFFAENYPGVTRAVSSATMADHRSELDAMHAGETDAEGVFTSDGNTITLVPGTKTIEARDGAGVLLQSWQGVEVYPLPVAPVYVPPAPLPAPDLAELTARALAVGLSRNALAIIAGLKVGDVINDTAVKSMADTLLRLEAERDLPRMGVDVPPEPTTDPTPTQEVTQ